MVAGTKGRVEGAPPSHAHRVSTEHVTETPGHTGFLLKRKKKKNLIHHQMKMLCHLPETASVWTQFRTLHLGWNSLPRTSLLVCLMEDCISCGDATPESLAKWLPRRGFAVHLARAGWEQRLLGQLPCGPAAPGRRVSRCRCSAAAPPLPPHSLVCGGDSWEVLVLPPEFTRQDDRREESY